MTTNKHKKSGLTVWEQEARGSSPRTPTIFGGKSLIFDGFPSVFVFIF